MAVTPGARQREGPQTGRVWYASPTGTAGGAGTFEMPLDLASAMGRQSPVQPGDTLMLRGGTYRGRFETFLRGTEAAPIVVRPAFGERATIDSNDGTLNPTEGALNLRAVGGHAWYWGLEITNSHPKRTSADPGSDPNDLYRANGVNVYASNVKLIDLVIHDVENGIFVGDRETAVEIDGVIAYYNGHNTPTTAWGHGLYVQNASRVVPRVVRNTITFSNVSHGIHAYGGADRSLNAIWLQRNISFQNGALSRFHLVRNLLLGGLTQASDAVVTGNLTYYSRPDGENNIGWSTGAPGAVVTDNHFIGGRSALTIAGVPARVTGNVIYGATTPVGLGGRYEGNTLHAARPGAVWTMVVPSTYDRGRGALVVYNWPLAATATIDLAPLGLRSGARYHVRDVQNFFGPPVATGVYDGKPVTVPLGAGTVAAPIGDLVTPPHTLPEFGVFVVTPVQARARN